MSCVTCSFRIVLQNYAYKVNSQAILIVERGKYGVGTKSCKRRGIGLQPYTQASRFPALEVGGNRTTNKDEKLYYTKNALKARGWTDAMIRDLLADVEIKDGLTCSAGTPGFNFKYYYEDKKVEAIEKTKAFKERKRKRIR